MDQSVCAGVGNIYRTEILYEAAIHPNQPANTLTRAEVLKLWNTAVKQMQAGSCCAGLLRPEITNVLTTNPI